jgi:DNA-binding IclR family transcriptional regulator
VSYEDLLALVREGRSPAEIATRLGVPRHRVHHRLEVLRRHGLLARGKRVADETLRGLVAEGLKVPEISARTRLTERHLRDRLRRLGLLWLARPAPIQPVRAAVGDAELLALRQAGLWAIEIAARTGMKVGTVRRRLYLLRRRGVVVPAPQGPPPNPPRRVEDATLLHLARAGLRPAAIAPQVGLAETSVQGRLRSLRRRGLLGPPPPRVSLRRRPAVSPAELMHLRTHFREALREDGVVCLECGAIRRSMGAHIRMHGLRIAAYRARWGYERHNALVVPDLSELRRRLAIAHNFWASAPPDALPKALAARRGAPSPHRLETRLDQREAAGARVASGWRQPHLRAKDETLRALVREGLTPRGIAASLGFRERHVRERIRDLGLEGPGIPPPRRPVTDEELLALRRAGLWNVAIAARTGMRPNSVSGRLEKLRKLGVVVPTPPRPVPTPRRRASDETLVALVGQRLRIAEIAARAGLAYSSIQSRLTALRRRGLLPPARSPRRHRGRRGPQGAAEGVEGRAREVARRKSPARRRVRTGSS